MAETVSNVTSSKPAVGGAIYWAPKGTTLPTTADGTLDAAFKSLGYVSDDGITNSYSEDINTVHAYGGDPVLTTRTNKEDTWAFTLLEILNVDVCKFVYGADAVTGDLASGIAIACDGISGDEGAIVVDMIMRGSVLKRTVLPDCVVTELGDITYNDTDAVGYETTVMAMADTAGKTHYEYIKKA